MAVANLEIDAREIDALGDKFKKAAHESPAAAARAIRRTGDMAWTRMVAALTAQSGLKRKVIARAIVKRPAGLTYVLKSRGGNVALKYFGARETRKGVSAAPWNARRVFTGTFIKGGRFPKRVNLGLGGQVFARTGACRVPIAKQKSGLWIPTEMLKGATREAFLNAVRTILPARLQHELARLLGGA